MYLTSKDRLAEGRFGAMFKRLPAYAPRNDLLDGLARTMVEPDTGDVHLTTGPRLFAGFTFIGQFIDHDITFDNTPLEQQRADPYATVNLAQSVGADGEECGVDGLAKLSARRMCSPPGTAARPVVLFTGPDRPVLRSDRLDRSANTGAAGTGRRYTGRRGPSTGRRGPREAPAVGLEGTSADALRKSIEWTRPATSVPPIA